MTEQTPATPPAEALAAASDFLDSYAASLWRKEDVANARGVSAWLAALAAGAVPDTGPAAEDVSDLDALLAEPEGLA